MSLLAPSTTASADTIQLRSGQRITDRTVASCDEDGLHLAPADGKPATIRLDEVESAKIASDKQAALDKLLAELGDPLFRIRWRLSVDDVDGLAEPAEQIYARYRGRRSVAALLVATAAMRGRIHTGQRESAVEPMLQIVEILRSGQAKAADLPGKRPLGVDASRAFAPELLPVWFDPATAKEAMPDVLATVRTMQQPRPDGVRLYYGSLAASAGDETTAKPMLDAPPTDALLAQLHTAIQSLRETAAGRSGPSTQRLFTLLADEKPAAEALPLLLYAAGTARIASTDATTVSDGALDLVEVAAAHSQADREVAAAALYQAAAALSKLKDEAGASAVRAELKKRFSDTRHGR